MGGGGIPAASRAATGGAAGGLCCAEPDDCVWGFLGRRFRDRFAAGGLSPRSNFMRSFLALIYARRSCSRLITLVFCRCGSSVLSSGRWLSRMSSMIFVSASPMSISMPAISSCTSWLNSLAGGRSSVGFLRLRDLLGLVVVPVVVVVAPCCAVDLGRSVPPWFLHKGPPSGPTHVVR